ncbi:MAG: ribosomal protein S18-alanine N-acetyltransferase [Breznakia sp.]
MIRKMKVKDVEAVYQIEKERFSSAYTKENFLYEMEHNICAHLFILERNNEIVAYIDYWITFDSCQLCKIATRKKDEGKGYAHQLMQHMFEQVYKNRCEAILLEVRISNKRAIAFYEAYDFLEIQVRKEYYKQPKEDALVLGKVMM